MIVHRKLTSFPAEHSCRYCINSQNSSKDLTLRHCPSSSTSRESKSSRKRCLGSSGNLGIRHRTGASGYGASTSTGKRFPQKIDGSPDLRMVVVGGKKLRISNESQPGTTRYPSEVFPAGTRVPEEVELRTTSSKMRHHHLMSCRSSRRCLPGFSILPGKRY